MTLSHAAYEGLVSGEGQARWNQSFYYQAYDPASRTGVFIRVGMLETQQETNSWLIVFRDGQPLFTRTNLNLPYSADRPATGVTVAGMSIRANVPLRETQIRFEAQDFAFDLTWHELAPMEDCIAMTQDQEGSFARDVAHVHLEGTSTITGFIEHRGTRAAFAGKGFRDVAAGVRNWDGLKHYRLAWPVFENGMAFAAVHGVSVADQSAWMRMMYDGKQWVRVASVDDRTDLDGAAFEARSMQWTFVDADDRRWKVTGRPLFGWLFPFDTFVLREQLMEFRLDDDTIGYGLFETGYRLPWQAA